MGGYLLPVCLRTLPNPSLVACCLAFHFSLPPEFHSRISSYTSPPTADESIQCYQNYPTAASPQISPKNLQPLSQGAGVYLEAVSNGSAPGSWSNALSRETRSPILSSTSWMQCSWPAPFFWQCASRRIGFASGWLGFPLSTTQVRWIVALIMCIIIDVGYLWQWGQVHNRWDIYFSKFRRQQQSFNWEVNGWSPRRAWRSSMWSSRAGRCWLIDQIASKWSWRYSRCTWRWLPLSWEPLLGEHLRLAITTLVEVISLSLWPIPGKLLAYTGGCVWTVVCHVEWRMEIKLQSAWRWLLWRRVTILMRRMILIGVFARSPVFACGSSWTVVWGSWNIVTAEVWTK